MKFNSCFSGMQAQVLTDTKFMGYYQSICNYIHSVLELAPKIICRFKPSILHSNMGKNEAFIE
jgi:hypothetical protein